MSKRRTRGLVSGRRGREIRSIRTAADPVGWKRWWRTQATVNRRRRRIGLYKCRAKRSK